MRRGWVDLPEEHYRTLIRMISEKRSLTEIVLSGDSMEPTYKLGSILKVKTDIEEINIGDVIVFINKNHLTAHRVIDVWSDNNGAKFYKTRGDAEYAGTEIVSQDDVIAKVIDK